MNAIKPQSSSPHARSHSAGLKLLLVCLLTVLMSVPLFFVFLITLDRSHYADQARHEIVDLVGGEQSVMGPLLAVPFSSVKTWEDENGEIITKLKEGFAIIFPEKGDIQAKILVTERKKSLYREPVYEAQISIMADFTSSTFSDIQGLPENAVLSWEKARLALGIRNTKGLRDQVQVTLDKESFSLDPFGFFTGNREFSGNRYTWLSTPVPSLSLMKEKYHVTSSLKLTGARRLDLPPFAATTKVMMEGNWPDPSLEGGFAAITREIDDQGFKANWEIPYPARGIPKAVTDEALHFQDFEGRSTAVRFIQKNNPYQYVQRALKYALLFISLVLLSYFLLETVIRKRVHAAQYVLIGLLQSIFYLLLLAFSEYTGFSLAFLLAAGSTVLVSSFYAGTVFGGWRWTRYALCIFTGVYALLYLLMRLEDFALMVGALVSFFAVSMTLYITRKLDWYGDEDATKTDLKT